jgi:hypothetical protein
MTGTPNAGDVTIGEVTTEDDIVGAKKLVTGALVVIGGANPITTGCELTGCEKTGCEITGRATVTVDVIGMATLEVIGTAVTTGAITGR